MRALANEIAKNLVLAGIGSLAMLDDQVVTEDDMGSQFFVSELHVGMNVSILPRSHCPCSLAEWRDSELLLPLLRCAL